MKLKQYLFFSLFVIFLASTTAKAQFRVVVKFGEIANLTYQLDCVYIASLPRMPKALVN